MRPVLLRKYIRKPLIINRKDIHFKCKRVNEPKNGILNKSLNNFGEKDVMRGSEIKYYCPKCGNKEIIEHPKKCTR